MTSHVFISGLGCVSPAGLGVEPLWKYVLDEATLLKEDAQFQQVLGRVSAQDYQKACEKAESLPLYKRLCATAEGFSVFVPHVLSVVALNEAMEQAGWDFLGPDDGFIYATTTGQIPIWEDDLISYFDQRIDAETFARTFKHQTLGLTFKQLCDAMEFGGRAQLITSACAAGTQALALAQSWIKTGKVKRCLVGGTELLCKLTVHGFKCFQLLSPDVARPFAAHRSGINLSEAAAFICLEGDDARGKSTRPLARISGGGISADAYHMTAPEPQGRGCADAIVQALSDARMQAQEIDWVHAHGTGSPHNDAAEASALRSLFGEHVWVSSTKAIHGHALGVSGLLEAMICVRALGEQLWLGTPGCDEIDSELRVKVSTQHRRAPVRHILKTTLGFGGSNGALIISNVESASERGAQ